MSKPLVIRLTKPANDLPRGAEVGVDTLGAARSAYGDGFTVVRHQDGSEYDRPKAATERATGDAHKAQESSAKAPPAPAVDAPLDPAESRD